MEKTQISIGGMHCASCAASIEKALKKTDGVKEASVNLAAERASVMFDPQFVVLSELRDVEKVRRYYLEAAQVVSAIQERQKDIDSKLKEIDEISKDVPSLLQ